jgi:hypothetical protein
MVDRAAGAQIAIIARGCWTSRNAGTVGRNSKESAMTRRYAIFANLLLSLPVVAGLLGTAPRALAQTKMTAVVPFAFSIGDHHLTAGSYSVEPLSDCFLAVRNNQTSRTVVLMVRKEGGRGLASTRRLVFQREERGMYLTQAWFGGSQEHLEAVAKPKRALEYAKGTSPAGQSIEVASK